MLGNKAWIINLLRALVFVIAIVCYIPLWTEVRFYINSKSPIYQAIKSPLVSFAVILILGASCVLLIDDVLYCTHFCIYMKILL